MAAGLPDFNESEIKAFELMNDPLRTKVIEIRHMLSEEPRLLLEHRYKLGETVLEVRKHPEIYGNLSDLHMAAFFGDFGKTIYSEARRICERYPPDRFKVILEARNPENANARIH
jgi:hypothetical protein